MLHATSNLKELKKHLTQFMSKNLKSSLITNAFVEWFKHNIHECQVPSVYMYYFIHWYNMYRYVHVHVCRSQFSHYLDLQSYLWEIMERCQPTSALLPLFKIRVSASQNWSLVRLSLLSYPSPSAWKLQTQFYYLTVSTMFTVKISSSMCDCTPVQWNFIGSSKR